ncbi:MAG: hypothetical protein ABOK23_09710 [Candidatus Methanoperedens sp.]|nr:hypothetical protein [Candidatus Methanoperedens sp.]MCZ7396706.1 hypothetical protein [Candidatus Methanoperedens sp.]
MSILDVTEDQIFHTLGRGKDPNFKPIEKVRPVITKPKKTYALNQTIKTAQMVKATQMPTVQAQPVISIPSSQVDDDPVKKLTADLDELNNRVAGLQKMVKWYIVPQFVVVLVLFFALVAKG